MPEYKDLAESVGATLAARGIQVVYGGACVGLMGILADAALSAGGEVYGFMPEGLSSRGEIAHQGITRLEIVKDMHERKQKMYDSADAFCVLPGGIGTLDELAEVITWNGLGFHDRFKPLVMIDSDGYWDLIWKFFDQMVDRDFWKADMRTQVGRTDSIEGALDYLEAALLSK